ncbi:MAG: phosphoenolpyruvate--protein phosphotransferase, partial [Firmicutes bacterium]|nr:phosphoenolpyruvate--protein phosphotransferase [Bacillota bacterium]
IGTNDLIQYTTAVDRGNQNISHLYDGYHPAVLRLIYTTIQNAHKNGIWVGMCGELASDELIIPLLLGMGIDELSMSAGIIPKSRWIVSNTCKQDWEKKIEKILNMTSGKEVNIYLSGLKKGE